MRKSSVLSTLFIIILTLCACSSDKGSPAGDGTKSGDNGGNAGSGGGVIAAELDTEELQNNDYSLKVALDFMGSSEQIVTNFEGTSLEHDVKQFSMYFADQKQISEVEADNLTVVCALIVEGSTSLEKDDVSFNPGKLNFVQISHSSHNSEYEFTVVLQAAVFQQFFVNCKNTPNSDGIIKHLGHILEIQPK